MCVCVCTRFVCVDVRVFRLCARPCVSVRLCMCIGATVQHHKLAHGQNTRTVYTNTHVDAICTRPRTPTQAQGYKSLKIYHRNGKGIAFARFSNNRAAREAIGKARAELPNKAQTHFPHSLPCSFLPSRTHSINHTHTHTHTHTQGYKSLKMFHRSGKLIAFARFSNNQAAREAIGKAKAEIPGATVELANRNFDQVNKL